MADSPAWAAVGISAVALGITIAQWVESRIWRRNQQERVDQLEKKEAITEARGAVNQIVTAWQNTMLSRPMVVHDRDLQELVSSARRWRKDVSDNQSRLIAHTAGVRTLAFRLVQKNVDAVMQFGGEVEAIIDQKLPYHDERDKVQHSVTAMQEVANPAIHELDKLKDEQLLQPG